MKAETRRRQWAARFARAINSTTARYVDGFMSRPTYRTHLAALWGQVPASLREQVKEMVTVVEVARQDPQGEWRRRPAKMAAWGLSQPPRRAARRREGSTR